MTYSADPDVALGWLQGIYAQSPEAEWVNIFMDDGKGHIDSEWAQTSQLPDLRQHIEGFAQRGDVYFSVATRRTRLPGKERGREADCSNLPGLWCDVDIADGAHKIANLPPDTDAARALVNRFPLRPSAVVHSGHGFQPWWLLAEPLPVSEARDVLRRWQLTWEAMASESGWHLDDVFDIPRMMRLPGTLNRKARPVLATYKGQLGAWQLSDLEDQLLPLPEAQPGERTSSRPYTAHLAGHQFNLTVPPGDVLTRYGATLVGEEQGQQHYHWPGASHSKGVTVYPVQPGEDWPHAAVYSETAHASTGIPLRTPHSAFSLLAWLFHGGSHAAARAWLISDGWPDEVGAKWRPEGAQRPSGALGSKVMESVPHKRVQWLWRPWLPRAKLVMLDGDPSVGKSTLVLDLVARISKSWLMPDGTQVELGGAVVLAAAEDDAEDTVKPRLMAADADMAQVHYITEGFTLPADLSRLESLVSQTQAVLVVIDVLYEYVDAGMDTFRDPSVRAALREVRGMAERTGATVLMLRHFTKAEGGKAIHKGGGSIGVVGAARAAWMVGQHPEEDGLHVLAPIKLNIAAMPQALGFRLVAHDSLGVAYVHWTGPVSLTADQLVNPPPRPVDASEDVQERALDQAVRVALCDGEWLASNDLYQRFQADGFTRKQIWQASNRLGVERREVTRDTPEGKVKLWEIRLVGD